MRDHKIVTSGVGSDTVGPGQYNPKKKASAIGCLEWKEPTEIPQKIKMI